MLALHSHWQGLSALAHGGYLAVDFFFVLSGFVLAHAYGDKLRDGLNPLEFMRLRIIRLWPLYALGSLAGVLLMLDAVYWRGAFAASLVLAMVFLPATTTRLSADHYHAFPFNFPAWSLAMELIANTVFALFAPRLGGRTLAVLLTAGAAGLIAAKLFYGDLDVGDRAGEFPGAIARVGYSFLAGVAAYRLWLTRQPRPLRSWISAALLLVMLAFPLELAWTLIGFPALVYFAAGAEPAGAARNVLVKLGAISYGVYVLQAPIAAAAAKLKFGDGPIEALALILVIAGAALALDALYDRPLRRWMTLKTQRLLARRPAPAV